MNIVHDFSNLIYTINDLLQFHGMTSEESEVTESVTEGMVKASNPRRLRRRRVRRPVSRERPATATLAHPNILDETLKVQIP